MTVFFRDICSLASFNEQHEPTFKVVCSCCTIPIIVTCIGFEKIGHVCSFPQTTIRIKALRSGYMQCSFCFIIIVNKAIRKCLTDNFSCSVNGRFYLSSSFIFCLNWLLKIFVRPRVFYLHNSTKSVCNQHAATFRNIDTTTPEKITEVFTSVRVQRFEILCRKVFQISSKLFRR